MLFEIRDIKFCNSEFPGISYLMHILILFLLFQCQSDCLIKSFIMMLSSYSLFLCLLKTLLVLVKKTRSSSLILYGIFFIYYFI